MYLLNETDNFKNLYKIVTATPFDKKEFKTKSPLSLSIDKLDISDQTEIVYGNKEGLPKVYNTFITEQYKDYIIIFAHHDILIEDLFFKEKLSIAFEKYDIVGLAGSKKCNLNSPMTAWHLMCSKDDMVGEVTHSKENVYWTTVFGPSDSRALILDGLFIAVKVSRLLETNTKFDENFNFHHYDISFCLRANANKLKMGVYPIKVTHYGLGDSMMSQAWQESSQKFKKLYNA